MKLKKLLKIFLGMIKENPELKIRKFGLEDEKTKLMCLSGVKQYPMRVKCATLSWHTLVSAFDDKTDLVKTEN
jgi:nitrogen fixation NifU-like protein